MRATGWLAILSILLMMAVPTSCGRAEHAPQQGMPDSTAASTPASGPGAADFDYQSDQTFTSGGWEYQYTVGCRGTRSEGYFGKLLFNGIEVPSPAAVNDYYLTSWGEMYWVGNPETLFGNHGWMVHPLDREPMGQQLPDPSATGSMAVTTSLASLTGQTWRLSSLYLHGGEVELPSDTLRLPTLTVVDSVSAAGFGGVNNWNANYSEPMPGEVVWSEFTTTEMMGGSEEQQLEWDFYEALSTANQVSIAEDVLSLSSDDGTVRLGFTRQQLD